MKKNRMILTVLLFFLFLLPIRAETGVYSNPDTGYTVYMMDQIDLLSSEEEAMLIEDMKPITAYGNVAFISARAYGDDTGSYAKDVYRRLMGSQSGMIFVIDMQNRNIWIHANGRVYQTITRAYANTITDNIYRIPVRLPNNPLKELNSYFIRDGERSGRDVLPPIYPRLRLFSTLKRRIPHGFPHFRPEKSVYNHIISKQGASVNRGEEK